MHKKKSLRLDPEWQPWGPMALWMTPEVKEDQPERYEMNMGRLRMYERMREHSQMLKYSDRSKIGGMTQENVKKALTNAVKDMNNWLFKKEYGDHPNNVFVNFLKKSLAKESGGLHMLDRDTKCGIAPNSVMVTIKDDAVTDLHFYNTNWPSYGVKLLQTIREEAVKLDYKGLRGGAISMTHQATGFENTLDSLIKDISNFKIR